MTEIAKALYQFFSSFGIPAYEENTVPDGAVLPYITYPILQVTWDKMTILSFKVWYRTTNISTIAQKVDTISSRLSSGESIRLPNGYIVLYKGSPFCQISSDNDKNAKYAYINLEIHTITN